VGWANLGAPPPDLKSQNQRGRGAFLVPLPLILIPRRGEGSDMMFSCPNWQVKRAGLKNKTEEMQNNWNNF